MAEEKYLDYFHMPLLVRPNTILRAVGSNVDRPDYDYTEGGNPLPCEYGRRKRSRNRGY